MGTLTAGDEKKGISWEAKRMMIMMIPVTIYYIIATSLKSIYFQGKKIITLLVGP